MALLTAAIVLLLAYFVGLAVYRLYFGPLAKFPGPKLAALSKWYEAYFEIVENGKFTFAIDRMHDRYGPIVRITPDEVHIKDSAFWDTLYVRHPKADKYQWMSGRFGNDDSAFTTADASLHRVRRGALNPMFSRRAILNFEPVVQDAVALLYRGIAKFDSSDKALTISEGFNAFSGDVITQYSFGFSYDHLRSTDFKENFNAGFVAVSAFGHVTLQFPWMATLLNCLPDDLVKRMNPPLEKLLQLKKDIRSILARIRQSEEKGISQPQHPTVFHTLLNSDLPPSEKTNDRLGDEAQTVLGAGVLTTAAALSQATFYILSNSEVHSNLRDELRQSIPDTSSAGAFDYQKLEKLPYLGGCIREAVRFSLGTSARNPRLLNEPLAYRDWTIPPRTPISMTTQDVHFDETIWKDARVFRPERWLGDAPKALDGSSLDRYLVAFGKGPRSCLGINLAYMELYIVLATVFRRFSLELYETDVSDVELAHDFAVPSAKLDSKGIRVRVLGAET